MSRKREDQEGPCLHCMMVELIDDFFAGNPATAGSDKVDTDEADEVIDAIAKTVAELTSQQDGVIRDGEFPVKTRQVQSRRVPGTKGGPAETALQVLLERSRSGSLTQELDGFFQFFGCSESDFLAGPNLNCLAGRRVAPHASASFSNLQYAEPRNSDSFTLLQMLGDQTDEVVEEFASRAFCQLMLFGQARGELGQRNGNFIRHGIPLGARIARRCSEEI